jgi:predicted hydrocarbon binding protein
MSMIVTRHISLDNDCIRKIEPYVQKHNNNFSAAIREIIENTGKFSSNSDTSQIDNSLFRWMLTETDGFLIPDSVLSEIVDKRLMNSMSELETFLNNRFEELGWGINIDIKYDSDSSPIDVLAEIKGASQKTRLVANLVSHFLVRNSSGDSPLEVKSVVNSSNCIRVELSKSNRNDGQKSLVKFFGYMDEPVKTIQTRIDFWKKILERHQLSNYNMVTVHRNYFEDLLAAKTPMGEITIENMARKPITEISLGELLILIKDVYETSRVVDRVDIDKDTIILYHNYRNQEAIEKLKKSLFSLLETNGHLYDAKSTANMLVLVHRPDIGLKINEIIDNLRLNHSRLDQELILFIAFLKQLKNIPDIPLSLTSLGRRIGSSLMQEYESENGVHNWDLETFRRVFGIIDSRLHRVSEWKLGDKSLLYTIRKCNLASDGNSFDPYICQTAREVFKGALAYAFGNRAEIETKKLLTRGDNFCEVLIRIP